jgi:hypothetical protein
LKIIETTYSIHQRSALSTNSWKLGGVFLEKLSSRVPVAIVYIQIVANYTLKYECIPREVLCFNFAVL